MTDLLAQIRNMEAAIHRVRTLHEPTVLRGGQLRECFHDGQPWPCSTIRALWAEDGR